MFTLWKFNRRSGYWGNVRKCVPDTAEQWLRMFSEDEPEEYYYLTSGKKPLFNPIPKEYQGLSLVNSP